MNDTSSGTRAGSHSDDVWPEADLEHVPHCPVCRCEECRPLHTGLADTTFRCAPGEWRMLHCMRCGSGFLNPRPTPASIGRAYLTYYTHDVDAPIRQPYEALSLLRKIRRRLVNGYTNRRFGTAAVPDTVWGFHLLSLLAPLRRQLDREYRSLPRPGSDGRRLLDLGCGDGRFLAIARDCGWAVTGLDPDPKSAASAAVRGLEVQIGSVECFDEESGIFDVITLNHVIEHLHDPLSVLRSCYRLLRPEGMIWIETPNMASPTHSFFGKDWRGLEAPRHLVLFNRSSLARALEEVGFVDIADTPRPSACPEMHRASIAMRCGLLPQAPVELPIGVALRAQLSALLGYLIPERREFLTLRASKGRT